MNSIWLKAAVAGGLWASFEIIAGSMLHNLHLPFSGTILTTFSVILMISFLQVWKVNGLIWRAGIICGLMKSLSPSAVILGPMTGIMMEAMVMDFFIFLVGKNILGYMLAGAGALLSTIIHKLASLFILYGTDLVTIYNNLFEFLKKQIHIVNIESSSLIAGIIIVYILVGCMAAISGYFLGRYAISSQRDHPPLAITKDPFESSWKETDPEQSFRIVLFFVHLIVIPSMLLLINHFGLSPVSIIPIGIYVTFLTLYYKKILQRLAKPIFWGQLCLMTLVAGIFWDSSSSSLPGLGNGFLVGIEMSLRAVLIVSAFSALSVEIRNPVITNRLIATGFGKAYAAISLSFNSLPIMLDRSTDLRSFLRNPLHSITKMIYEAELWLQCYRTHLQK